MPNNLIVFALGPIQDFIASARRSRDLWYGSWLLSDLSRTAARMLKDEFTSSVLIFPKPANDAELNEGSTLGVANKIVAIVPGSPEEVAALANRIEAGVRRRLDLLAAKVFDDIDAANLNDRATAEAQVRDLAEFYWAAHPLATNDSDYAEVRSYLEALLAARKVTRDFRQLPGRAGRPKSSLDGLRESVIPAHRYPTGDDAAAVWNKKANRLYRIYGAGPAEQLSGIDLLKRQGSKQLAGKMKHFPSTSHIAALPFLKRIDRSKVLVALGALIAALDEHGVELEMIDAADDWPLTYGSPPIHYDASLLYPSRLTENIKTDAEKREITKALNRFLQEVGRGALPQPYYALLRADGDRMGATIDAQGDQQAHKAISAALNRFAGKVDSIVSEYEGAAVYSGGDDVLAFLPLHTALECAEKLAQTFQEQLSGFTDQDGHSPTLSTGIAVTHHLEPMSDALRLAGEAEKAAKHVDGKHGLAIVVSKRSGVDRLVAAPRLLLIPRLDALIKLYRTPDGIAAGAAYQIQDMLVRLAGVGNEAALRFETQRILQRKPSLRREDEASKEAQQMLTDFISQGEVTPAELVQELIIAQFFANAQDLAKGGKQANVHLVDRAA